MTDLAGGSLTGQWGSHRKSTKIGRTAWVGLLNQALTEGLANSQWLAEVEADQLGAGKQISQDLWPFIMKLPDNIKSVQEKLPRDLEPAKLFLSKLADEERQYQALYLQQCELAGLSPQDLMTSESHPTAATSALLGAMSLACVDGDVVSGAQAVVAAELAAAHFARGAKAAFERYFSQHASCYAPGRIDEGLAWLRLHAKTNTRHALLMNRMLAGLSGEIQSPTLPSTVKQILHSIFWLWHVDQTTAEAWLGPNIILGDEQGQHKRCQAK